LDFADIFYKVTQRSTKETQRSTENLNSKFKI
jgi:hypothetical protein